MSDKTTPKLAVVPSVGTGEGVKQWWCPQCGNVVETPSGATTPYCFQHGHPMTGTTMQEIQPGEPTPVPWDQPEKKPGTFGAFTPYPEVQSSNFDLKAGVSRVLNDRFDAPSVTYRTLHKKTAKGWRLDETSTTVTFTLYDERAMEQARMLLRQAQHEAYDEGNVEAAHRNSLERDVEGDENG